MHSVQCLISHGQPCTVHVTTCTIYVDEPDVGTLPHTKAYSDDDENLYSSDEESGDGENEKGYYDNCACDSCVHVCDKTC